MYENLPKVSGKSIESDIRRTSLEGKILRVIIEEKNISKDLTGLEIMSVLGKMLNSDLNNFLKWQNKDNSEED